MIELILMIGIAFLAGKIFQRIKLPAILGWLIAGIAFGYNGFNIITLDFIEKDWLKYLLVILETIAGSMIGAELIWSNIKKSGKSIVVVTLFQSLITFGVVTLAFMGVFYIIGIPLYLAVLFGSIALATAPAPSISIVNEYKTKGPVTQTLVPMAALDDVVGIIIFFTVNAIIGSKLSGAQVSLMPILLMVLGPVIIGVIVGGNLGVLQKNSKNINTMFLLFLTGLFITGNVGFILNRLLEGQMTLSYFMMGLAFCATFANIVPTDSFESMFKKSTKIVSFSLMLLIFSMGIPLNIKTIGSSGLFTIIYIISRMIGKISGAYIGSTYMKMPETVRKYLGFTLLPHSGVSLFFTTIASTTIMPFDPKSALIIQSTISGAAVVNEIIAVLLAKKGFEKAGEINRLEV